MAQLEDGWPLGLQPLSNVRVVGQREYFGSTSFNTLLSGSTNSSTHSSSDLDTESTGSFFHDKSNTLGRLIGVPTTADLPKRRSISLTRLRKAQIPRPIKSKPKAWCFSLCPTDTTDTSRDPNKNNTDYLAPSLGQFLAVERRAGIGRRRSLGPMIIGPDELGLAQTELNSLFVNGLVAPPPVVSPLSVPHGGRRVNRQIMGVEGHGGVPLLFSCMCG